jgi:hypothetical protein
MEERERAAARDDCKRVHFGSNTNIFFMLDKADPNDPHLSSLPPDLRKEYVVTPGGLLMHRSCVHQVENGETVNFVDGSIKGTDGQVRNTAPCKYPSFDYSGVERPGLPSPPPPDEGTHSKRNQ